LAAADLFARFKVYEDEEVLAFLGKFLSFRLSSHVSLTRLTFLLIYSLADILPIRSGHLLVVPKKHYERV